MLSRKVAAVGVLGAVVIAACSGAPAGPRGPDHVYNVLPPGQAGDVPPGPNSIDQLKLYDGLTPLIGNVTAGDLTKYYKPEIFGLGGEAPTRTEQTNRPGLQIQRDSYDVPHINGQSRADVEFGAGWVTAEDRGLFIEVIRGPARVAFLDAPGIDAFSLAISLGKFVPSADTEKLLTDEADMIAKEGPKGRQALADVDSYVAGINAYYSQTHNTVTPWGRNDVLAAASLIGAVFGKGGGDEVARSQFLSRLQARLGPAEGRAVWNDLSQANDPEAPTTISKAFPYEQRPTGSAPGSVIADAGSSGAAPSPPPAHASNALLVGAGRSASGHPIAVMGPQVGYYYPQFLMELDLHGGGIDARGVAFPGVSQYVLLGRGAHYAWSATSSDSDVVDQFAEELCNPDGSAPTRNSTSYVFNGQCRAMTSFTAGVVKGTSEHPADQTITYHQTVHGPVSGTMTVGAKPYAITSQRSTRGRDVVSAFAFADLNTNQVRSAKDFAGVMNQIGFTFNWFYVDAHDIAFFSSGRLPLRAAGTDPGLPTLGTGQYEWAGFLPQDQHPQAINPPNGQLLNWNNKPATGFEASDNNWGTGSIYRVMLFRDIKPKDNHPEDIVSVMNRAATQDLRATLIWPQIARVLTGGSPDASTQQARDLISSWAAGGASRLNVSLDGKIDNPGAAVMDASWARLARAVMEPVLGPLAGEGNGTLSSLISPDDQANSGGSSYADGWYGYVYKDLRSLLGDSVAGKFSRPYCGNGDLSACRTSLWAALKAAVDDLASHQGPDPTAWRADATKERIKFLPQVLGDQTMRWTNRPTFQQVVTFDGNP